MNRQDRRDVSREYFSEDRLAEHHFRSFNAFLERGMQQVAVEKKPSRPTSATRRAKSPFTSNSVISAF
jgi:hypothetical protein